MMNTGEDDKDMMLEPTPLSDEIHYRHLFYQQQQLGLLSLEQSRLALQKSSFSNSPPRITSPPQSNSPGSLRARRRLRDKKLRVEFASHVLIHFSPNNLEDIETCWYTKDDLADFRNERKAIVKALHTAKFDLNQIDSSRYNLRGLEPYFSPHINKMMQRRRINLVKSVLAEQARQKQQGIVDTEAISKISCAQTEWARDRGQELGFNDALEVDQSFLTASSSLSNNKNTNRKSLTTRVTPQTHILRST